MSHGIRNSNSALSDTSQYVLRLPAPTQGETANERFSAQLLRLKTVRVRL